MSKTRMNLITCHSSPSLTTFAFRSSEVRCLLLDFDPHGGTEPLGMFPHFLRELLMFRPPVLVLCFRSLSVQPGSFLVCWRQANVSSIPKGPPSSSVANYRPISITSALSKMFQCLMSVRLRRLMECRGVLPTFQHAFRKDLCTCDALFCMSHMLQIALERGQEARIAQIDFSAALDRVTHQGILY